MEQWNNGKIIQSNNRTMEQCKTVRIEQQNNGTIAQWNNGAMEL